MSVDSSVPLEEQVREQIREAIARGEVVAGDPLPSVRQLAGDLGIHWNTVARAYRRLRDEGLLVVGRGRGVTVRDSSARGIDPAAPRAVAEKLREAITEGTLGGLYLAQVEVIFQKELKRWRKQT